MSANEEKTENTEAKTGTVDIAAAAEAEFFAAHDANDALQCHVFDAVIADVVGLHAQQREALESALQLRRDARLYLIARDDDVLGPSVDAILNPEIDKQEILRAMSHADAAVQPNT